MIKISIIIPVYNKELFLGRCFDSILNQIDLDQEKFEIIVVDDGSTDTSPSIIKDYIKKHQFFSYFRQKNSGVSVARNAALDIAVGNYVLFLDADDELIEGALPKLYDFLSKNDPVDMLVTRQTINNGADEKDVIAPTLIEGKRYNGVEAFQNQYVRLNAGGGICRTDFLRKNHIRFPIGVSNSEDTIFFGLVQVYAKSIIYLNLPLYRIYILEGSASRVDNTKLAIRHINTVKAVVKYRNELNCSDKQKGIFEFYVFQLVSNTIGKFIKSKDLGYRDFCKSIDLSKILPFNTQYMCMMKKKAMLFNFSYKLYYLINWVKICFKFKLKNFYGKALCYK